MPPDPDDDTASGSDDRSGCVIYNFYGSVDARGGVFGDCFDGRCIDGRLRYTTGRLREAEVLATVSNFVRPSTFDEAVAWLRRSHLLVLNGPPGSGRRAGAMALLREVTDSHIVALSPALTAEELAEREYLGRYGYLVIDTNEIGNGHWADRAWASVTERVRAAGTYLVVTTTTVRDRSIPAGVPQLAWERPSVADVLRRHLDANWAKDDVNRLVNYLVPRLPANYTLRWLGCVARLVNAGRDPARALRDMEEMCGRQVNRWFDQPRTHRELAEATVAAVLADTSEPTYDAQLAELEGLLMAHQPLSRTPRRYHAPRAYASGTRSFGEHPRRRWALSRIWDIGEGWFLAAVGEWIDAAVSETERLDIASGLALLAYSHYSEVESSFLEPWSRGKLGWPGQVCATYVLWFMCRDESTAPLALRIATRWANAGDTNQRATAMLAFGGELGVTYPTDAAHWLWQLMTQTKELRAASRAALGRLLALLVDQTTEAGTVLTMLDTQYPGAGQGRSGSRMRRFATEAALAVVTAPSHRTGRPAVAELLRAEPERQELVGRLWAVLLSSRSSSQDGLWALWNALCALPHISTNPTSMAAALGRGLSGALSGNRRSRIYADLIRLDNRLRGSRERLAADVLFAFREALS